MEKTGVLEVAQPVDLKVMITLVMEALTSEAPLNLVKDFGEETLLIQMV
jgi:hypothetical protein